MTSLVDCFFWFTDRRIIFDFEKIGDAPSCVDKAGTNLDGQEGLIQGFIDSDGETFRRLDHFEQN